MGQIKIAAAVKSVHQLLIEFVAAVETEAHQVERRRDDELEALVLSHPGGELLRESHVLANVELQAFDPVIAQYKPEFERAKTAAQRHMPVAIVDHSARFSCFVAQIFGQNTECFDQTFSIGH